MCRVQNVAKLEGDGEKEGYGRMSARKFEVDAPGEATHQVKCAHSPLTVRRLATDRFFPTRYGPDIKTAPDTRATFELVDPATEPFVRLQFKYRSRGSYCLPLSPSYRDSRHRSAFLQSQGHLPSTIHLRKERSRDPS